VSSVERAGRQARSPLSSERERPRHSGCTSAPPRCSLYSLPPFLWIVIASITPDIKDYGTLSGRRVSISRRIRRSTTTSTSSSNNPFALYFRNSAIIATGNMLLTLVVASLGAYAFVRFRFAAAARSCRDARRVHRSRASCCWCRCS
jgi:ABC-type Fe3+ transport system permease subunit